MKRIKLLSALLIASVIAAVVYQIGPMHFADGRAGAAGEGNDDSCMPSSEKAGSPKANSMKVIQRLKFDGVEALAWSHNGRKLAAFGDFGSHIKIWDTGDWRELVSIDDVGHTGYAGNSFAYLPGGTLLTPGPAGKLPDMRIAMSLWDANTGKLIREIPGPSEPIPGYATQYAEAVGKPLPNPPEPNLGTYNEAQDFVVSRTGALVAAVRVRDDWHIQIYETKRWSVATTLTIPPRSAKTIDEASSLAFSPDGRVLAVGTGSGKLLFYELSTGKIIASIIAYQQNEATNAITLAFSPDGSLIAAGSALPCCLKHTTTSVRLWRVADGKKLKSFEDSTQGTFALTWSRDGTRLAAVGNDNSLHIWRISNGTQEMIGCTCFAYPTYAEDFSPDGRLAASGGIVIDIFK